MRYPTAVAAIVLLPSLPLAWGGESHQIVALIAEERLTPQAQVAVHELLAPMLTSAT